MSIKTKLIIILTLSVGVISVLGALLFTNNASTAEEVKKTMIISKIQNELSVGAILRNEYLITPEERSIVQWKIVSQSIDKLLMEASTVLTSPDEQIIFQRILDNEKAIVSIFFKIINSSFVDKTNIYRVLTNQLAIKTEENINASSQLVNLNYLKVTENKKKAVFFGTLFIIFTILIILVVVSFVWFYIVKSILKLKESSALIASLDFSSIKAPISCAKNKSSADEISQLECAFYDMAFNLKQSEAKLNQKVRERTKDLSNANKYLAEANKSVTESEQKYKSIVENSSDQIFLIDKELKYLSVNKCLADKLNKSEKELIGKPIIDTFPKNTAKKFVKNLKKVFATGKNITVNEEAIININKRYLNSSLSPIMDEHGNVIAVTGVVRDVTDAKKAEAELYAEREKTIKLEKDIELDKNKAEFVSLASHQLRTPLTAIKGYVSMILEGDVGKITKGQKDYLKEVSLANERMIKLINEFLDVSKIDMGIFTVESVPVNIKDIAEISIKDIFMKTVEKKQKIVLDIDPKIGKLNLDPRLTGVIFQNLLTNANAYTPEGGTITLTIKKNKFLYISVSDTGIGITKNQQYKIFSKLFRADNAKRVTAQGSGLGLYVVKAIITASKGKIWFESEEDKGTTFHIQLPINRVTK